LPVVAVASEHIVRSHILQRDKKMLSGAWHAGSLHVIEPRSRSVSIPN
jgi:hypothetical protein